ncbi:MAG: hypothetical protein JOZ78_10445 [Chroococcidiopsidaceae cyanobacterium CP_BM_ER_R8_30]|nr:hypothetical protein [Chroococcidiopsidaceae cyanobacterium CP_BM_ER_R8_30]
MPHFTIEYYSLVKKLLAKAINQQHEQMVVRSLQSTNEWDNEIVAKLISEVLSEIDPLSKQWFVENFWNLAA